MPPHAIFYVTHSLTPGYCVRQISSKSDMQVRLFWNLDLPNSNLTRHAKSFFFEILTRSICPTRHERSRFLQSYTPNFQHIRLAFSPLLESVRAQFPSNPACNFAFFFAPGRRETKSKKRKLRTDSGGFRVARGGSGAKAPALAARPNASGM